MKKNIEVKDKALIDRMKANLKGEKEMNLNLSLPDNELLAFANKLDIDTKNPFVIRCEFINEFKRNLTFYEKEFIGKALETRRKAREKNLQTLAEKISKDTVNLIKEMDKVSPRQPNEAIGDAVAYPNNTEEGQSIRAALKKVESIKNGTYEMVNHPSHYNSSSIETIEKMRRIWGDDATALWCEMTAFKYRDRIGNKPDNSLEQEAGKIKWYEAKAKELRKQ